MNVEEYVSMRKRELDEFIKVWKCGAFKTPEDFPEHMEKDQWEEQELAFSFEIT